MICSAREQHFITACNHSLLFLDLLYALTRTRSRSFALARVSLSYCKPSRLLNTVRMSLFTYQYWAIITPMKSLSE